MSWIVGTASDYKDLSDQIVAAAAADSLTAVVINAAGTGYVVGDILSVAGGTSSITATIEVTSVGGSGEITGAAVFNSGVYSVNPTTTANAVTGGTGSSATMDLTMTDNGWTVERDTGRELSTIDSIAAAGTGYSVNDIITLAGGVFGTVAKIQVDSVGGSGEVLTASIDTVGDYDAIPNDPVEQDSVAPTGGSGATFNLTFEDGEREVVLNGEGGGSDNIYVGWRTLSDVPGDYYNWELHGMAGFDSALKMESQILVSPGFYDQLSSTLRHGAYLLLHNSSIPYWLNIDSYRIILIVKVGSAYFNMYLGWGNRFATSTEYPYPLYVSGHTSYHAAKASQSQLTSGLTDPWRDQSGASQAGPAFLLDAASVWWSVLNSTITSANSRAIQTDRVVVPAGRPDGTTDSLTDPGSKFMHIANTLAFDHFIETQDTADAGGNLHPTDDSGGDIHVVFPTAVIFTDPTRAILMELDHVFWVSGFGSIVNEDRIQDGGTNYRVFQNCNRTNPYAFLAIREL